MSTIHAGVKRSYHEMHGAGRSVRDSTSQASSREQSPLSARSQTPNIQPFNADTRAGASIKLSRKATFDSSASLVLIGVRGAGTSTLGVLAATAYNRRLVDSERAFSEATGSTAIAYRKANGSREYQRRHNQILENTLKTHTTGAVIVCSFSDLESNGAVVLSQYAQSHPVIHVTRDAEGIQSYLQVLTLDRIKGLISATSALLRSSSNFEFFNLSETSIHGGDSRETTPSSSAQAHSKGSFLTLKRVERDFLRLLRNIIGDHNRGPSHQSAYPLSRIRIEDREHTFAVNVKASAILAQILDLDEMQIGADCVEMTFDLSSTSRESLFNDVARAFSILRRATILPILVNMGNDYGVVQGRQPTSLEMTEFCLRLGPEFCNIDLSSTPSHIDRLVAGKGSSRVIGVWDFSERPPDGWNDPKCVEIYTSAAEAGCDIVKITIPAQGVNDLFEIHSFKQSIAALNLSTRLISYSTGLHGKLSNCFNKILTSVKPSTFVTDGNKDSEHSGEIFTAKELTQSLFSNFMLQPLRFYIYGADVSYSLSPAMHNGSYDACGMNYSYTTHSSDDLDDLRILVRQPNFGGAAIVQPFKTAIFDMMAGLSASAKATGALNTIVPVRELLPDGSIPDESAIITQSRQQGPVKGLYGFNTDWIGIRACIRRGLSPANSVRSHTHALVCGAGGMARSAVYSLISLGVRNIFICNRTVENANALVKHYQNLIDAGDFAAESTAEASPIRLRVLESFQSSWPSDARQPTIIVSCVPRRNSDLSPVNFSLPEGWLKSPTGGVVVEVAYRPPVSPLVHQIRDREKAGWILMTGYDMLPEQAYSQFELFTGRRAPRKLMRDEVMKHSVTDV